MLENTSPQGLKPKTKITLPAARLEPCHFKTTTKPLRSCLFPQPVKPRYFYGLFGRVENHSSPIFMGFRGLQALKDTTEVVP